MRRQDRQLLENYIYRSMKKALFESWNHDGNMAKKQHKDKGQKGSATKRGRVMKWLDSAQELHSVLSYKLFNARTQGEKDAARSLFSKKYRGAENDNGSQYGFSEQEVNTLYSMMNTYLDKLS